MGAIFICNTEPKGCLQTNLFSYFPNSKTRAFALVSLWGLSEWLIYHLRKTQLFGTRRKIVFVPSCHSCYDVSRWSICHRLAEIFQQKWFLSKNLAAMHSTWRKIIDGSPQQRTMSCILKTERVRSQDWQQTTNKGPKCLNFWKIEGWRQCGIWDLRSFGKSSHHPVGRDDRAKGEISRKETLLWARQINWRPLWWLSGMVKFFLNLCCRS